MAEVLPQTYWASYALGLGNRVRMMRMMRGLTQVRLAEIAGLSRSLVSNLERNDYNGSRAADPTLSTVYRLAGALYVPPAVLLPGAGHVVGRQVMAPELIDAYPTHASPVSVLWPLVPTDTARFAEPYLKLGAPQGCPRFMEPPYSAGELGA